MDERGTLRRSAFPFAIRSAADKRTALKLLSFASSARLAPGRKKSSSLAYTWTLPLTRGKSRATIAAGYAYLNFIFKRVSGVTIDARETSSRPQEPGIQPAFSKSAPVFQCEWLDLRGLALRRKRCGMA